MSTSMAPALHVVLTEFAERVAGLEESNVASLLTEAEAVLSYPQVRPLAAALSVQQQQRGTPAERLVEVYLLVTHASIYPLVEGVRLAAASRAAGSSSSSSSAARHSPAGSSAAAAISSVSSPWSCPVVLRPGLGDRGVDTAPDATRSACPAPRAAHGSGTGEASAEACTWLPWRPTCAAQCLEA